MKKKLFGIIMATVLTSSMAVGCGKAAPEAVSQDTEVAEQAQTQEQAQEVDDKAVADEVAALIDAIYVQERTETTDADCAAAKAAWDALTDTQKELVEGENADPDYFGRDTGDASKDDPLNQDEIGENEILVVSFGTSFNDSRAEDIGGIEKAVAAAFPDWSVRRAFTAQIIINHVQARDGEFIDNMDQALERAVNNGVKNLIVQPTHLMHGAEYDELVDTLGNYSDKFENVYVSEPLLGEVGKDASIVNDDKKTVAEAVVKATVEESSYDSLDAAAKDSAAIVYIGHGTSHAAKVTYSQMQTQMNDLGYENVFVGTVEGEPEETSCESIIDAVHEAGYTKVIMRPLMVVAGDHANNDMAGDDEDSWKSMFNASGYFESVDCQIAGLGRIEDVQKLYIDHLNSVSGNFNIAGTDGSASGELKDGTYLADFDTDGSMFHVNEVCEGKGTLTVKNGEMTIHIVMPSKNTVSLFEGSAEDAQKEGAKLIEATVEEVTYSDGLTEEVNAFDVPVPYLDKEFDLALVGTKGKWYDHKVKVSNPEAADGAAEVKDGEYTIEVTMEGGSGKATIESPTKLVVKDGMMTATITWSSPNYDYMIVSGQKYEPVNKEGNSVFEIPVAFLDKDITVIGDTTAMSKPHEVEYTLNFKSDSMK
ncbi:MAG: cobalt chelatase [Butyrivibrio sp.]|nr:cobalt chelatase [Butyrivibrio sp.]